MLTLATIRVNSRTRRNILVLMREQKKSKTKEQLTVELLYKAETRTRTRRAK